MIAPIIAPIERHSRLIAVGSAINQMCFRTQVILAPIIAETDLDSDAFSANVRDPQQKLCDQKSLGSSPIRGMVQSLTRGSQVRPSSLEISIWYLISGRGGLLDWMCAAACTATIGSPRGVASPSVTL